MNAARDRLVESERELTSRQGQMAELERELVTVRQLARSPDEQREQVEQDLLARREQLDQLNQGLLETGAKAAHLAGEKDALTRIHDEGAAYESGVQALLQSNLPGILGPLATLIQVPKAWEQAIGAALGPDLQAVVAETSDVVERARQALYEAGGRLTLLPLDALQAPPILPEGTLRAADVVTCDQSVRPAVETLLGPIALCQDQTAARALLPNLPPGGRCVTPSGLVFRADRAVVIHEANANGLLAQARLGRELPEQMAAVEAHSRELQAQKGHITSQIEGLEQRLEALAEQATVAREEAARVEQEKLGTARTEIAVAEEALRNQQAILRREQVSLEQLEAQQLALRQQAQQLEAEHAAITGFVQQPPVDGESPGALDTATYEMARAIQALPSQLDQISRRCAKIEQEHATKLAQIAALESNLADLASQADQAAEKAVRFERETLGEARTRAAVAKQALQSQQAALERESALQGQLETQIAARHQRAAELDSEYAAIEARTKELRESASQMEATLSQARTQIQPAEEELSRLTEELTALEERENRARDRMRDAETRHGRAQLEIDRRQDELELLAQRIEEDLGLVELELDKSVTAQSPLPLRPMVSSLPVVEELPEGLEEEIQRLKARLRRLGGVNPDAPSDYDEVRDRYDFLTAQSSDLEQASEHLNQVIAELDEMMEAAFKKTFAAVATRFAETFTILFNGGSARLELTEPDDLMNTGVDIVARPPGKRSQRLALLSGGERSLTAVALLFALLHVSPAPFCVLDEVDAMLDEANVGRFRGLLEDLSNETQFVVITHNRGTIEAANTIYGVSMGADGVSQVISRKLD